MIVVHRHGAMYVYAFLKAPVNNIELPMGIKTSSTLVVCEQLAALAEPALSVDELQQTDQQLVRAAMDHDRVIQELFQSTTVLPLHFGTSFLSQAHLMSHLRKKQRYYCDQLQKLDDKAEYLVKLLPHNYSAEVEPAEKAGCSYIFPSKNRYETQVDYREQQKQEFNDLWQFLQAQPCEIVQGKRNTDNVERLFLLLQKSQEGWFRQLLGTHTAHCWNIHIGEALPPYHFVS